MEGCSDKLGIFPASYVQLFDFDANSTTESSLSESCSFTSFYYTLLDPLFLQVIRTLREWHSHLLTFYRSNTHIEKYQSVRRLMYELVEICEGPIGRELAPTLWRRRCNQILKGANSKDPFMRSYLDEDDNTSNSQPESDSSKSVLEPSLEELYDRILSKLNQGNQLLNLEIMPSFTHGTFSSDNSTTTTNYSFLIRRNGAMSHQFWTQSWGASRGKFRPYLARENSKYLTSILDYYNRLNQKYSNRFKSTPSSQPSRTMSFHSPLHCLQQASHYNSSNGSSTHQMSSSSNNNKKYRRHLLLSIREANFKLMCTC